MKIVCGFHNHLATKKSDGHSFFCRLFDKEKTIFNDMTKSMIMLGFDHTQEKQIYYKIIKVVQWNVNIQYRNPPHDQLDVYQLN